MKQATSINSSAVRALFWLNVVQFIMGLILIGSILSRLKDSNEQKVAIGIAINFPSFLAAFIGIKAITKDKGKDVKKGTDVLYAVCCLLLAIGEGAAARLWFTNSLDQVRNEYIFLN